MSTPTVIQWADWCTRFDALQDEVLGLHHSRGVWRTIRYMIETNPVVQRSGIVEHWLTQCYSVTQLSGVRRQVDQRKDVVSLWRLLDQLARQPSIATRAWFVAQLQARPQSAPYAARLAAEFDAFTSKGSAVLDGSMAASDRDRLRTDAQAAKRVVDQFVAHQADVSRQGSAGPGLITWGELDRAIDTVGDLYKKYYRLRHPGNTLGNLEPELPAEWDRMFATAWKHS
jgi:hypothetical protein